MYDNPLKNLNLITGLLVVFSMVSLVSLTGASSISGTVYSDNNMNGEIDPGEQGMPGVLVRLYGYGSMEIELATYTDTNGNYLFDLLSNGWYIVDIVPDPVYRFTRQSLSCSSPLNFPVGKHRYNNGEYLIPNLKNTTFKYIGIGDSIGFCTSLCNITSVSPNCYQKEVESRLKNINPGVNLDNMSVPGYETSDLLSPIRWGNIWGVVDANPQLVTISIGGNDFLNNDGSDTDCALAWINARANAQELVSQLVSMLPATDIEFNTVYDNDADTTYPGTNPFHARWVEVWNQLIRDIACSQRRQVVTAEIFPEYRHCDANNSNCCGIPSLICRDSVFPYPPDDIHPNDNGYKVHSEKLWEALGGITIPGTNGTTSYSDVDHGYTRLIATRYPTTVDYTQGSGATNLDQLFALDGSFATIPSGDQEIHVNGFDATPAGTITRIVACIRFKTSGLHLNDVYRFEISVDGTFTPPPTSLTPFNLNTIIPLVGGAGNGDAVVNAYPEYANWRDVSTLVTKNYDSIVDGHYHRPVPSWVDISTISIRLISSSTSAPDSFNILWDAAWLEIYGVPPTPTVMPTSTPTNSPVTTPTGTPTNTSTFAPTPTPTVIPTNTPTIVPSNTYSPVPTATPTITPTVTFTPELITIPSSSGKGILVILVLACLYVLLVALKINLN